jgi:hypothetical protein
LDVPLSAPDLKDFLTREKQPVPPDSKIVYATVDVVDRLGDVTSFEQLNVEVRQDRKSVTLHSKARWNGQTPAAAKWTPQITILYLPTDTK